MNQTQVIFGSTHSPPIGIMPDEMEETYQNYYRPLLKALYAHPQIHLVLFFSGNLLKWLEKHHGEFFDVLVEMVKRRQLEILGGGYYAPMLNLISKQDSIGQIELLTTYLRRNFGRRPRGCWITEQIWEPFMPSTLKSAGMDYVFLNEYHFWKAGFEERDFYTPCITEDQGKTVMVFPMVHDVYQNFWQMTPDEIRKKITDVKSGRDDQVISLIHTMHHNEKDATDIETHLENILSCLDELLAAKKIDTILPSRYLRKNQRFSRGYFPATSFDEMQAYGSSDDFGNYLHRKGTLTSGMGRTGYYYGNLFRQNLSRYNEVNLMYAKMQFVQSLTTQIRGDIYRRKAAREELWRGQSNAPFWHGERGGVYENNYRKEIYAALIRSEKLTREQGIFAPSILSLDFDMDGLDEFLYQGNQINAYIHSMGGILFELDFLPSPWNYLDTMGRYPEVYHGSGQEAQGYDAYPRKSFVDHFLQPDVTIEHFTRMIWEGGCDFANTRYDIKGTTGAMKKKLEIPLFAEGILRQNAQRVSLEKTYSFSRRTIQVQYCITNTNESELHTIFSPEINLSFVSNNVKHLRFYSSSQKNKKVETDLSALELESISQVIFEDQFNKVRIEVLFSPDTNCWSLPLNTEHLNRNHWQETYQASTLLPRWTLHLGPGEEHHCTVNISMKSIRRN